MLDEIETESEATVATKTRTVTVITRHSTDCKDKNKGSDWRRCNCRKSLVVYEDGRTTRISAKTRSWEKAERFAKDYEDSLDPEKQELKRLRAQKERQQITIEAAVALYTADMVTRLGNNSTVWMARSLLGRVDPVTNVVKINGHLFDWLATLPNRPVNISEITPVHLTSWRASWKFGDLTAKQRWGMVKSFFNFCESQGWIESSPAKKLKPLRAAQGNRTAIFTDDQYAKILDAVYGSEPENAPDVTKKPWAQRLTVFIELLRWSGMDLVDATQYHPDLVDAEGVLRYRRQKTGVLATIPLPEHMVALLRNIPLEEDIVGSDQPFRQKDTLLMSNAQTWGKRLMRIFKQAGITAVRTGLGKQRTPHAKMLRDTFAVYNLRHGVPLHSVSKMLGHSRTQTTETAYLPWVKELEDAHIAVVRKAQAEMMPRKATGEKVLNIVGRKRRP